MPWSLRKVLPFTMHPDRCIVSEVNHFQNEETEHEASVRWIHSSRVGVLRRTKERKWFVAWFDAPKSRLQERSLLFGGGEWSIRLQDADKVEPVTEEQLRAMGMSYSLKDE
jgi:hypothetical protein